MVETSFDGVRFFEGRPANARAIEPVRVNLGGMVTSSQLKSLDDVKREMARLATARGGNAIIEFKYGQRSVGFLASLFSRDDVRWYGEGQIASVPPAK